MSIILKCHSSCASFLFTGTGKLRKPKVIYFSYVDQYKLEDHNILSYISDDTAMFGQDLERQSATRSPINPLVFLSYSGM